ncbi:Uncharacterised protein [Vibrio cholerae]|nr:Uncharacterised protein [Vibrio cholerae]CSC58099.1 Uncharacterised protein [Vibrio cholerae]
MSHNQPATSKLEIIKSQKKPRTCSSLSRARALCLRRACTNSKNGRPPRNIKSVPTQCAPCEKRFIELSLVE